MHMCLLEAHRGVGTDCPEETRSAFRAAIAQGYGMIELDTKFTADNRCVIHHDRTVNRMARRPDGSPLAEETPIAERTFAQLAALDYGIAMGEAHRGIGLCSLEEVVSFARENRIPLKFDNVLQSHTPEQLDLFFSTIEQSGVGDYAQFTANRLDFIQDVLSRIPNAHIHYDGPASEETLKSLGALVPRERLTVWLRFPNRRTAWNKTPPVDETLAALVRRYAKLGVWLLETEEELRRAVEKYAADVVETDGSLKPGQLRLAAQTPLKTL